MYVTKIQTLHTYHTGLVNAFPSRPIKTHANPSHHAGIYKEVVEKRSVSYVHHNT